MLLDHDQFSNSSDCRSSIEMCCGSPTRVENLSHLCRSEDYNDAVDAGHEQNYCIADSRSRPALHLLHSPFGNSDMPSRQSGLAILMLVAASWWSTGSRIAADETAPENQVEQRVEKLIEMLGSDVFEERRSASRQLQMIGSAAIPQLKTGATTDDPEISRRCQQVLDRLYSEEHRRMLAAFQLDPDSAPGSQLPGWAELKKLCGDTDQSRTLMVRMHEREHDLLAIWSSGKIQALSQEFTRRCVDVQQKYRGSGRREVKIETLATLLFVSTTPRLPAGSHGIKVPEQTANLLNSLLYYNNVRSELQSGKFQNELRRLIAGWVQLDTGSASRYQKLLLAMRYNLPEGLIPAQDMIDGRVTGLQLQYALLAIGKLGTERELPLVLKSLNNGSVLSQSVSNGKITYKCEVRDVALAIALHLTKQDAEKYDFARLRKNSVYLYSPNSAGFASQEARNQAFSLWDRFVRERRTDPPQKTPANPTDDSDLPNR